MNVRKLSVTAASAAMALGVIAAPASAAPVTDVLVPHAGATWNVWDQGPSVFGQFQDPAFDTTGWKIVVSEQGRVMGYGDNDVQQPALEYGGVGSAKHAITYFRTSFEVTDPAEIDRLIMNFSRDDGIVVFLNGVEVGRDNMPSGTITSGTYSATTIDGGAERAINTMTFGTENLVAGTNVLAIQLHQRSAGSSDIALRAELLAESEEDEIPVPGGAPSPVVLAAGAGVVLLAVGRLGRRSSTSA